MWLMGLVPTVDPPADRRHHPTMCMMAEPYGAELDEAGTLVCPHGEAGEDEGVWRNKRHEIACNLIMEVLVAFEHEGWPSNRADNCPPSAHSAAA